MKIVVDIEANGLKNPTEIWVIVCKDIETNTFYIFRNVTSDQEQLNAFLSFSKQVRTWIGHNWLGYDYPVLQRLTGLCVDDIGASCYDTLVLSRLIDFSREGGHSIENYGVEFGEEKIKFTDFSKYTKELEEYCIRDVNICHSIYSKYKKYLDKEVHKEAILLEQRFQLVVNQLGINGFSINVDKANKLLNKVTTELNELDLSILKEFPKKSKLIREITPKATKFGTISLTSIPKALRGQIEYMSVGEPFSYFEWVEFNPSSHKQIIEVLNAAKWKPTDKTKTHIDTEREYLQLQRSKRKSNQLDTELYKLYTRLQELGRTGWKVNETNLSTLPSSAPAPARMLAKRILLESRRRTLTEWLGLVQEDGRIHGDFQGIGAWTHRMAHQKPNTANIPNEYDLSGKKKLLGKELRSLWQAPKNRLLVGVDAEGIQLRIFAHYIDDEEFTNAIVNGKKEDKSDPHNLNMRILGDVCKSRAAAKRFIFALLLGAGIGKLAEILSCSPEAASEALDRLMSRYTGFQTLKETIIPRDAKRGWFTGLDGRSVAIPGDSVGSRRHLAMSGYLQNGEAVVMKAATLKWHEKLLDYDSYLVNFVHDEWQVETPNDVSISLRVAEIMSNSLKEVGEDFGLKCPLAGSYWNDDLKDYTIGTNWSVTH